MVLAQTRVRTEIPASDDLLLMPCPEALWNASNVSDWHVRRLRYQVQPLRLVQRDMLRHQRPYTGSWFSSTLLTCSLAAQLEPGCMSPTQQPSQQPVAVCNLARTLPHASLAHAYLALYDTPLHDLLAVAGDTWVFGKKITPATAFDAAQQRLKAWSFSLAAARACQHACMLIRARLVSETEVPAPFASCLSDYWVTYLCVLICWAFGQRTPVSPSQGQGQSASDNPDDYQERQIKIRRYIDAMLAYPASDLLSSRVEMKGETSALIETACVHLERTGRGSSSMMLVDAICVLRRIGERGRVKWF